MGRATGIPQRQNSESKDNGWDIDKATLGPPSSWDVTPRRTFDANKYKTDQFMYPSDLMSPSYGGNYVIFYINVSDDSKLKTKDSIVELDPTTEKRMRGSLVTKNISKMGLALTAGGMQGGLKILSGAAGGYKKAQGVNEAAKKPSDTVSTAGGAVSGAVGGAADAALTTIGVRIAGSLAPDATRSQRRLKTAIALHVPNQLSIRYATMWGEEDTAAFQALNQAGGGAVADAMGGGLSKMASAEGAVVREAAANIALTKIDNKGAVSAALGIAANPKKEQVFQGVDFRKFTFEYQFYPRDINEAQNVLNIIHQFKLHMHPEFKSELNYVWIYPSEFDVIYYTAGGENMNIHRHTSCVLESMNVNYTPNGNFSVFPNGMPTQINISLDFRELQLASKETIGLTPGGL